MKKKNLKSLKLNRKLISKLDEDKVTGGRDGNSISGRPICQTNCPCSNVVCATDNCSLPGAIC